MLQNIIEPLSTPANGNTGIAGNLATADLAPDPVGQAASVDELLTTDELAEHANDASNAAAPTRPWLQALPFEGLVTKYPNSRAATMVAGIENWFLLLVAVLIAGGLWWHFNKSK